MVARDDSETPRQRDPATSTCTGRLATDAPRLRRESVFFLVYYGLFMGYMAARPESELLHWLSLVAIPFTLIVAMRWRSLQGVSRLGAALASVGLRRGTLRNGLGTAILVGLACSAVQLVVSDRTGEVWRIVASGRVLLYLPLVVALLLVTAGFTEEFFFRGVLLTRLRARWGAIAAVVVSSLLFGLYHFPYVYLLQSSQLRGDVGGTLLECAYDAAAGLLLGVVYLRSRQNLVAPVLVHVLINALPAMTLIHFGSGGGG